VPLVIGGASWSSVQRNAIGVELFQALSRSSAWFIPGFPVPAHQSYISAPDASPDLLLFAQIMIPIAAICQESDAKNEG